MLTGTFAGIESTFLQRASISVMACCLDFIQLPKL